LSQSLNNMKNNRSGAIEISFGWLFAIVAGIVIIFFAIYLSTKLIGTEQTTKSAETGKEIGILLNPLETSFESAQTTSITIPAETRINNKCELTGTFGRQLIQLDQKSFNKWTKTDVDVSFYNKYIFSEEEIEGKKFYIFSKPFYFPFKVADLIYMTSSAKRYCFIESPNDIQEELSNLHQANILTENCSDSDIKVCFNNGDCNISVDYSSGSITKNNEVVSFDVGDTALMYAGIFSDKAVYECQLRRLMLRVKELSNLYINKETIGGGGRCGESNLVGELGQLSELAGGLTSSEEISIIKTSADGISEKNGGRRCKLW
jgi:hypothetical protein